MSGGQGVEIDIDEIEQIGTGTMPALSDQARSETRPIRDSEPDPAAFGQLPAGQDFARVEAAAKAIYVATVDGVERDLAEFGLKLQQSARNHRDNEDAVAAALTALNAEYVEGAAGPSHADEGFQQGNAEQSEQVDPGVVERVLGGVGEELPGDGGAGGAETVAAEDAATPGATEGATEVSTGTASDGPDESGGSPGWSP